MTITSMPVLPKRALEGMAGPCFFLQSEEEADVHSSEEVTWFSHRSIVLGVVDFEIHTPLGCCQ